MWRLIEIVLEVQGIECKLVVQMILNYAMYWWIIFDVVKLICKFVGFELHIWIIIFGKMVSLYVKVLYKDLFSRWILIFIVLILSYIVYYRRIWNVNKKMNELLLSNSDNSLLKKSFNLFVLVKLKFYQNSN